MAMGKRMAITLIAATLAAASATAFAHGGYGRGMGCQEGTPGACMHQGGMHQHGMHQGGQPMAGPERAAARLAAMKDALQLQPAQQAAWAGFEAKVKDNAEKRSKMREAMADRRGNPDAMAEFRVTMMKFNAQAAEETLAARKALVAVLTPEQKAAFDRFGPGMMAGGGHGHRGPGMGGRGGPGCNMAPTAT